MAKHFYKTGKLSESLTIGKKDYSLADHVRSFHHLCEGADRKAQRYAKRYGATSFIEPAQGFTGGVEYLIFDKAPDADIWKEKSLGGCTYYEPNIERVTECAMFPDKNRRPSDTSSIMYRRLWLTWEQVKTRFGFDYWHDRCRLYLTGSKEEQQEKIDSYMHDKHFMLYYQFSSPIKNRRKKLIAIRAEMEREKLPVIPTAMLYEILQADSEGAKRELVTPSFVVWENEYYISSPYPCKHPELTEITEAQFRTACDYATREPAS